MSSPSGEPVAVATFDCYGTLIDWEGGVGAFLHSVTLREGEAEPEPGRALRERWEAIQLELIQGDYRPYKEVLGESLRRFGAERGWPEREGDADALVRIGEPPEPCCTWRSGSSTTSPWHSGSGARRRGSTATRSRPRAPSALTTSARPVVARGAGGGGRS